MNGLLRCVLKQKWGLRSEAWIEFKSESLAWKKYISDRMEKENKYGGRMKELGRKENLEKITESSLIKERYEKIKEQETIFESCTKLMETRILFEAREI